MKKVILSVALIAAIGFTSCTSEKKTDKDEVQKEEVQKSESHKDEMAIAEYQCPMKCEDEKTYADKDHKCPVCKMDLKEVKQEESENHDMDADKKSEENHNHEEGDDKH
ncbi:MAG: heavy metal-binding domain-containing protein [Urechidicola sp.]|nr:heavy metal-binding domain-containing protein [Urechidicola sp.]